MVFRISFFKNNKYNKIIDILASIFTVVSIIISSFLYVIDRPTRKRDTVFAAWQIVASMEGKKGSGYIHLWRRRLGDGRVGSMFAGNWARKTW